MPSSPPSADDPGRRALCSRSELRALATKAGLGAGLPIGIAERWAEACCTDGDLVACLARTLSDGAGREALLGAPSAVELHACGLPAEHSLHLDGRLWDALEGEPDGPPGPVAVPAAALAGLRDLALRTLVPFGGDDIANAGAGLTDND